MPRVSDGEGASDVAAGEGRLVLVCHGGDEGRSEGGGALRGEGEDAGEGGAKRKPPEKPKNKSRRKKFKTETADAVDDAAGAVGACWAGGRLIHTTFKPSTRLSYLSQIKPYLVCFYRSPPIKSTYFPSVKPY